MNNESIKYPPKGSAKFIVCEDVRAEVNGKLVMVGVYPGETINFFRKPTPDHPGRVNLALSFWMRGGRGTFETKLRIICPDGDTLIERQLQPPQTAEEGKIMTFILAARNAEFKRDGKYKVVVSLNDRDYEFPLFVTYTNEVAAKTEAIDVPA
jgi:hypothetical protein